MNRFALVTRPPAARTTALAAPLLVALSLLVAGCTRPTLASMPAPSAPGSRELTGDDQRGARDALARTVVSRLGQGWTVSGARFFLTHPDTPWNAIEKLAGNDLEQRGAARFAIESYSPGHDLLAVWKVGWLRADYLAAAITPGKTDGQLLVGYFDLDRD